MYKLFFKPNTVLIGVIAILFGFFCVSNTYATTFNFTITDTSVGYESFDDDVFDDDVDFSSGAQGVITAKKGDVITWNQNYSDCYKVLSDDKADIDELTLFTRGDGTTDVEIEFWLTDEEHKKISQTANTWTANNLAANKNLKLLDDWDDHGVYDGGDVLGSLKDIIVCDFHLKITVLDGEMDFGGGRLLWEAGDIEKVQCPVPEPGTIFLLGGGLLGLFGIKRGV